MLVMMREFRFTNTHPYVYQVLPVNVYVTWLFRVS